MNCYVYRRDAMYDKDSSVVQKTLNFDLPLKRGRDKEYKIPPGASVFTCGTSDFFLNEADEWRIDAWNMIKHRIDLTFEIITKRIDRFHVNLPSDWGEGYENVCIGCTAENQDMADYRLPIFLNAPIRHRFIICEPLLEKVDLGRYLSSDLIENVVIGGESGNEGRVCDYAWVLSIRDQCIESHVPFYFKQTGTHFKKGSKVYTIERKKQHSQARKANINT
jgi:protein gp37